MIEDRPPADCFICVKHAAGDRAQGGIILADDLVYVGHAHILDDDPATGTVYPGYLMVEPRRHVPRLGELTDDEAARIGVVVNRVAAALLAGEGAEHVYSFVFGDNVDHLHVHLAPRYPGTPERYRGARLREWPEGPRIDLAAMTALCDRLRAELNG